MRHSLLRKAREPGTAPGVRDRKERWRFALVDAQERTTVERFIYDAYRAAYGARIAGYMPQLAALHRGPELLAACGLRRAGAEPLFLETYLDVPVERRLAGVTASQVRRSGIVEVGNLAIARPGAARMLIALLTEHLLGTGEWAVFTAVPALRNNFAHLGIPLHILGEARPDRLGPDDRQQWGRYYECSPQVSAVRVADAVASLRPSR